MIDPKIAASRRFTVQDPATLAKTCYSEWCMDAPDVYLTCPEMPWKTRNHPATDQHNLLLPWPMFESDGAPRIPRSPTSGTPDDGYMECWGRVQFEMEPHTILTYQATGLGDPDLTVCKNTPANAVGDDCSAIIGPGGNYPSTYFYEPLDPIEVRKRAVCGLVCSCCPCAKLCLTVEDTTVTVDTSPPADITLPGICISKLCFEGEPVFIGGGGWGWVADFTNNGATDDCGLTCTSAGDINGTPYIVGLAGVIIYAQPRTSEDCYITVVLTWTGTYLGLGGDGCTLTCIDGVLDVQPPGCTVGDRSFAFTTTFAFGVNACPTASDPSPKETDIEIVTASNPNGFTVVTDTVGGHAELTCEVDL